MTQTKFEFEFISEGTDTDTDINKESELHAVLLSGGLDSATLLYQVTKNIESIDKLYALSIDYGQKHNIEIEHAIKLSKNVSVEHQVIKAPTFNSALTNDSIEIPKISYSEIKGMSPAYVPFRNGIMLSLLAAKAVELIEKHDLKRGNIYYGAHAEDAENYAYADCTIEFINAIGSAIRIGTYGKIILRAPFSLFTKSTIVKRGYDLGVPFEDTWSCYSGGTLHCGKCSTCLARIEAFKIANVTDPTQYE